MAAATFRRPLAGISVSGLRFRCFGHRISKFPAPERWDFNISGSGASGFQDFQLRSVAISIFPAPERQNHEFSIEINNFRSRGGGGVNHRRGDGRPCTEYRILNTEYRILNPHLTRLVTANGVGEFVVCSLNLSILQAHQGRSEMALLLEDRRAAGREPQADWSGPSPAESPWTGVSAASARLHSPKIRAGHERAHWDPLLRARHAVRARVVVVVLVFVVRGQ